MRAGQAIAKKEKWRKRSRSTEMETCRCRDGETRNTVNLNFSLVGNNNSHILFIY